MLIKKGFRVALAALVVLILFSAQGFGAAEVARVNGVTLTESDLQEALNEIIPTQVFHRAMTPEKMQEFVPQAMDLMIERELLYQEAKRRGMKADKKKINKAKKAAIERLGGKKRFQEALKQAGLTEKQYEIRLEKRFLAAELKSLETDQKANVSPEEIEAYYERNKSGFFRPEARRVRHILIRVEPGASQEEIEQKLDSAKKILERARSGEDFGQLAWEYSEDPYRMKSGDLGLLHRGRLLQAIDDVVFSLPVGGISDIITTEYGYHIVKVEEAKEPEQLSLSDVYSKIENELKAKKLEQLRKDFLGGLKQAANIEILRK